jgi:hypothetical protein
VYISPENVPLEGDCRTGAILGNDICISEESTSQDEVVSVFFG